MDFGFFDERDWSYDVSFSYDRGVGFQSQQILFEPNLVQATAGVYQDQDSGEIRCGVPFAVGFFGFDTLPDCVPFQAFAPSIFESAGRERDGSFATQEEFDYLTGLRTNRSVVEQTMFQAYLTGDLFDIPGGGTVKAAFGGEFREDAIETQNDITGVQSLIASEVPFQEGQTIGSRTVTEFYGEVALPLIQGRRGIEDLSIDLAARYTDEEFFGSDTTYRFRGSYSPVSYLTFSGSYGTSFRAPNLREQFLADQGGAASGGVDPCNNRNFEDPDSDPEQQFIIQNCIADGVEFFDSNGDGNPDSTVLGTGGSLATFVRVGGNDDIQAETSRSYTGTVTFSQPFTDVFAFDLAVSYFDIVVNDAINELSPSLITSECYANPEFPGLTSPFCDRVTRRTNTAASDASLEVIDASFVNVGEETVKGIDINTRLGFDLQDLFGASAPPVDVNWATSTSHALEQEIEVLSPEDRDDNVGEIGFPEWRFNSILNLSLNDLQFTTQSRFISAQAVDEEDRFPFQERPNILGSPSARSLDFTGDYWVHDASVSYNRDRYGLTFGVRNLANRAPEEIGTGGANRAGAVTSVGYDFFGRTYFVNGTVRF
ncbi:MAG: TonB-dependent receptor [Pseudomonadota bacterium]